MPCIMTCTALLLGVQAVPTEAEPRTEFAWIAELDSVLIEDEDAHWSATVEAAAEIFFTPGWSLGGELVLEPLVEGDGSSFSEEALYLGVLELTYAQPSWAVSVGKFGPNFSTAYQITPGIRAVEAGEAYEVAEQIGLRSEFRLDALAAALGAQEATGSAAVFMADRSILSRSLLRDRGRLTAADGGAGNTGRLQSYSMAVDVIDAGLEGLWLHASMRSLESPEPGRDDDRAAALAINYIPPAGGEWAPGVNLEYVLFEGGEGDGESLIAGLVLQHERWSSSLVRARSWRKHEGLAHIEAVTEIALTYSFTERFAAGLGRQMYSDGVSDWNETTLRFTAVGP